MSEEKTFNKLMNVMLILSFLIASLFITSCTSKKEMELEKKKKEAQTQLKQIENNIAGMAEKYNAVRDWNKNFADWETIIYTIELEDELIRKDSRPVFIIGTVSDVIRKNNKLFIKLEYSLSGSLWDETGPMVYFTLEAKPEQIKSIMSHHHDILDSYATVAKISSIERPKFEATADIYDDESPLAEVIVRSSDIFIAKGKCLDLLFADGYEPKK